MGVHRTEKYGEIRSLLEIPFDEPIFILRAQDRIAPGALDQYATFAEEEGASQEFCDDVRKCVGEFHEWQQANLHSVKVPD